MPKLKIPIKLDRERNIRFTTGALLECEEHYGKTYREFDIQNWDLKNIVYLLYQGLKHEDADLTLEKTAELIDEADSFRDVFDKIAEAYAAAFVGKNRVAGRSPSPTRTPAASQEKPE